MGRLKQRLRRLTKAPGVPQVRHVAERSVAPYLRADLHGLSLDHGATERRVSDLESRVQGLADAMYASVATLREIERHMPAVLNAIASANGTARRTTRSLEDLRQSVDEGRAELARLDGVAVDHVSMMKYLQERVQVGETQQQQANERTEQVMSFLLSGDDAVRAEMAPHIETVGFLLRRLEVIRAEVLNEMRYQGTSTGAIEPTVVEPRVVNREAAEQPSPRLNLGAGHIPMPGYVNVDMRELPGVDVVATVDNLPWGPQSVAEIFSSHTLEHFPEEQLTRVLLPYWFELLEPGGTFRAVVPDMEAMIAATARGEIDYAVMRSVTYGGQEYEGDIHFNGFTPASLSSLLDKQGFTDVTVLAEGRPNGDSLELEVAATKPAS